jgi:ribosomal protein S18 acetylase RimI-like enzyme
VRPFKIKIATPPDAASVIQTVTRAFRADPVARWFYPDAEQYEQHFPRFVEAFAGAAFEHGSADCLDDYSAAAFWLPPGAHADDHALATLLCDSIPERSQAEVFSLLERMEHNHPDESHWYLPMIGVVPARQGSGCGSALLQHGLQRCDADRKLAYLESSDAKNIPLYERYGFELLGKIQAGSSPPLFPMLRRPRVSGRSAVAEGVFRSLADFPSPSSGSTGA